MTDDSLARFEACKLGTWEFVRIDVIDQLEKGCVGLYHCGEHRIELLSPAGLDRAKDDLRTFRNVPSDRLFSSVLHHELAHALYETRPCPYENCLATSEYFAYSQQIAALDPRDRATITARMDFSKPAQRDSINAMILFMAPDAFIATVWVHFTQRPEPCQYWRGILDGRILFDRFHP
ncbi:DUF6639 family protein [Cognatishimia sp. F0-27]|uniref:DUF6639 family protein n=1 Tax=Cognatishimia sp. F0-27 TaxID=2816855 RepID=UPI001D0C412D|nr:DUF6639 family protein [Cognatishimia sp. F0-27]MCC1493443.1 hypothetical protein [Cognatishimia sp. F0-27]